MTYWLCDCVFQDLSEEAITRILADVKIPEYRPSEKVSCSVDLNFTLSNKPPPKQKQKTKQNQKTNHPNLFDVTLFLPVHRNRWDGKEAWSDKDASKQWRGKGRHHSFGAGYCYWQGHTRYANTQHILFLFFLRLKETQADWQIENVKAGVLHLWLTIGVCVL